MHMPSALASLATVLALTLAIAAAPLRARAAQAGGLKIVVIAGEDAVNIIQQKTAIAPLVEVRDRNDLPVSGVPVTFTIAGPNATFGSGLQTVSVTTNAAGRAAVTSLTPVNSGAVQINVSASYQGQTLTATITQTNFATAAAAAAGGVAVTGVAAAAGAGGAGGGLSGLAIAGIVGGIGAGAVVAAKATGAVGGSREACAFSVSPTAVNTSSAGGNVNIGVEVSPANCDSADWTMVSNAPFITGGSDGRGTQTLSVFVAINPGGSEARTGTVTVAGHTVTITQTAQCTLTVSPTSITIDPLGGSGTINITVVPPACENPAWTAATISSFIFISPTSGSGSGVVTVTMGPTTNLTAPRTGTVSFAGPIRPVGAVVQIVQPGLSAP
jgi:hypothetical protein